MVVENLAINRRILQKNVKFRSVLLNHLFVSCFVFFFFLILYIDDKLSLIEQGTKNPIVMTQTQKMFAINC